MRTEASRVLEFGDFRVDLEERRLFRRDGTEVLLTPRVFETLRYLVEHGGRVLDKELIMEAVWPDCVVEENNLAQNISTLRRIFGDTPASQKYIVTVPARGYRFVPEVKVPENGLPNVSLEASTARLTTTANHSLAGSSDRRFPFRAVLLVALLLALAAAVFFWRGRAPHSVQAPASAAVISGKSIAVLPFENLSDEKQNAYFAAGVQDEILSDLARIADLKVISRTSANLYKSGNPRNSLEIGQQLGVAHLLEGSVQRIGDRLRVHVQLIDARTDTHVWAQTYDREAANIFAIQSEIAQSIAAQLQAKLSPAERAAITRPPTADLTANALYAQAIELEFKDNQGQSLPEAVRLLDQAVARDPQFVRAYCMLGRLHLLIFNAGYDHTPTRRELANVAIQNAVRLQPDDGEVHLALARYAYYGFLDYDRARAELDLARRLLPNDVDVYFVSGVLDRRQGRWSEAVRNFDRALELDPRNLHFLGNTGGTYEMMRRYSESSRFYERALVVLPHDHSFRLLRASQPFFERADVRPLREELSAILAEQPQAAENVADFPALLFRCAMAERDSDAVNRALASIPADGLNGPNVIYPHEWFAGLAARAFNDTAAARSFFTAARAIAEKLVGDQPDYAPTWSLLGQIDAALGRKEEAVREGRRACELLPLAKDATVGPALITNLAIIYAWTGQMDLALEQLAMSAQIPAGVTYGALKLDPEWDALRGDPRFEKIVASLAPEQ